MSLEASAGKNPITHVGKLYNVMAGRVTQAVVAEVPEVEDAYCYRLSRIGHAIADPCLFEVKARLAEPARLQALGPRIADVATAAFAKIYSVWREAVSDSLQLW